MTSRRWPRRVLRWLVPLLGFTVLACCLYWPASPLSAGSLPDGGLGDSSQEVWFLAWVPFALRHLTDPLHTTLLAYPSGIDVTSNTSFPLLGLLAAPLTWIAGPIVSFNVLLRLGFAFSAFSMYLVLRSVCRRRGAALAGALLYGFGPYTVSQAEGAAHLALVFLPFPPLICWCCWRLFGATSHRAAIGALLGLAVGAQLLVSPEVLADLALLLVIAGIVGLVFHPGEAVQRFRTALPALLIGLGCSAILAGWFVYGMLFGLDHVSGSVQPASILQAYSADLLGPIVPTHVQLIAPTSLATRAAGYVNGNTSENTAYLGVPLLLLLVAFVGAGWRNRLVRRLGALVLVAFVFSLGGHLVVDTHTTGLVLPEDLLVRLPLLDNAVPARFGLDVLLFASMILGLGIDATLDAVRGWAPKRRRTATTALGLTCIAAVLLLFPRLPLQTSAPSWSASLYATLDALPNGSAVLTYPLAKAPNSEAMIWQAVDGFRFHLVGGYVTIPAPGGGGQLRPVLLEPAYPEEFFVEAQEGGAYYYPSVGSPTPADDAALCAVLDENRIGAVVFSYAGPGAAGVEGYLLRALGAPATDASGVLVWPFASATCKP